MALAWQLTTSMPFNGVADNATDNRALLAAAITAAPAGGVIELRAGTYYFDVHSAALAVTQDLTIRGAGEGVTVLRVGPENTTMNTSFVTASGTAVVTFEDMTVTGPTVYGGSQVLNGFKHNGTAPGMFRFRRCAIKRFTYCVLNPGFLTGTGTTVSGPNGTALTAGVEADDCRFVGLNGTPASNGIAAQASSGRVRVTRCSFKQFGLTGDVHSQALYIGRGYDTEIVGCDFDEQVGGRCIQFEDQISDLTTNGVPSRHQIVDRCVFGSSINVTSGDFAILTTSAGKTTITKCVFKCARLAVEMRGEVELRGNTYPSGSNTSYAMVRVNDTSDSQGFPSATFPTVIALLDDERFTGATGNLYDVQVPGGSTNQHHVTVTNCKFMGGTTDAHVRVDSGASGTNLYVEDTNLFKGTSTTGTYAVDAADGALVTVLKNQFRSAASGQKAVRCGTASKPTRLLVDYNNFSQASTSVTLNGTPPANYKVGSVNYGSTGAAAASGGTL